jgi:Phage tail assembly chaperone proteins, E, or 41 or 14
MDEQRHEPISEGAPPQKVNGEAPRFDPVLRLVKQVVANGDTVKELKFREPTAADITLVGCPVIVDLVNKTDNPLLRFDAPVMTAMMAHLAGVPPSTINQMDPRDWNNGAWRLVRFFVPDL